LYQVQIVAGRNGGDAELLRPVKIIHIVRDNVAAAGGERKFQHHVVIGVGEEWPPQEMDFLKVCLAGEVAQEAQGIVCRLAGRQVLRPRSCSVSPTGFSGTERISQRFKFRQSDSMFQN
jgi:hypothetical protein